MKYNFPLPVDDGIQVANGNAIGRNDADNAYMGDQGIDRKQIYTMTECSFRKSVLLCCA